MLLTTGRRSFLKVGAASLFGMNLSQMALRLSAGESTASKLSSKSMILLWLDGAPSTIDMWDPKPEAVDNIRGDFATISTSVPGVPVCEHLPKTAEILNRCTLIRSMHHNIPEHGPGSQLMLTGHQPSPAIEYPSIGSLAARLTTSSAAVPSNIAFDKPAEDSAGYLGSAWNAFELENDAKRIPIGLALAPDADVERFRSRVTLRNRFDKQFDRMGGQGLANSLKQFQQQATSVLEQGSIRSALSIELESQATRDMYGEQSVFGHNALKARRLIEAGARFVTVGFSGWDTHSNNFTQLRNNLLPQLDRVVHALVTDLNQRGMLESTIVCCCGEFGRTPNVNGSAGRDHWSKAFSVLLAGGGFHEGKVYGQTDPSGNEPSSDPCTPAELCATLLKQLGVDTDQTITTSTGRPMRILESAAIPGILGSE